MSRRLAVLALAGVLAACGTAPQAPEPAPVAPPVAAAKVPPRVGLALGGGAARGFAHVGVIQALARDVNTQVGQKLIESMPLPLGIVATDLSSGQGVLFQRGDTGTAVRASSAVPAVFQPVKIGSQEFVDGGLVSPVPVRYARAMGADVVIAVDISSAPEGNPSGDSLQIVLQTFAIMGKSINVWELKDADVVVRPPLNGMRSADFAGKRRALEAGRSAMRAALPALQAAIAAKTK